MNTADIKIYELFKNRFNEAEAQLVIEYFENKVDEKLNLKKDVFLTKDDKIDIIRSIYTANIIQFIATIGTILAIIKFMMK